MRSVVRGGRFEEFVKVLSKKDRKVDETIDAKLEEIAKARRPPRDRLQGVNERPFYKVRFRLGNRMSGRLIVLVDSERVAAIAAYSKNKTAGMTGDDVLKVIGK